MFDLRPIRRTDAALIVAALTYTSDETYYRRFRAIKRYFSPKELEYLTEVDGTRHVALVAIERSDRSRLAAVARFCTEPADPLEAELAICVHDPFRRQGLGAEMLRQLHDEASSRGLKQLRAMVQSDNIPMRELLYHVFPDTRVDGRCDGEVDYLIPVQPPVAVAPADEHRARTSPPDCPTPNTRITRSFKMHASDAAPVRTGSTVTYTESATGDRRTVHIVASGASDPTHGRLSEVSPVGSALLGHRAGELVRLRVPRGERHLRIDSVL